MTTNFTPSKTAYETKEVVHPITGRRFMVEFEYDYDNGAPESESDGHGHVVTLSYDPHDHDDVEDELSNLDLDDTKELEFRAQCAMMRHIKDDTYYDVWRSLKTARKEGWGRTPEAAVEQDFRYIYGWYNDQWYWCGIRVTPLDILSREALNADDLDNAAKSLWGIESNDETYHEEVIKDLMHQCEYALWEAQRNPNQLELPLTIA